MKWIWTESDTSRIKTFLNAQGLKTDSIDLRTIGEGHSNITTLARLADQDVILRHQPALREGAPDVLREARFLQRMNAAGVLAPKVLAIADAGMALDVPLYVMEHVRGTVISGDLPPAFAPYARQMGEALMDGLAALHAADASVATSRPLDDPESLRRHFAVMAGLAASIDTQEGRALQNFGTLLHARIPTPLRQTIVHSDYRLGNMMWQPDMPPRLAVLLDWELATIGDPRLDLGYFMASYPAPELPQSPLQQLGRALYQAQFPPIETLLQRYEAARGQRMDHLGWFAAFVAWKTAIFFATSRLRGEDSYYDDDRHCVAFLAHAQAQLNQSDRPTSKPASKEAQNES